MPVGKLYLKLGVLVHRGHVYRLTAEYDNPTGAVIPGGGMGALAGALAPDEPAAWPAIDHDDPQLKLDWHLVHTGNQNGHGGGHHHAASAAMPAMGHGMAAEHLHSH